MLNDFDDRILNAVRIAEARERHGVKPPRCTAFECTRPGAVRTVMGWNCEAHEREANAACDTWPPIIE